MIPRGPLLIRCIMLQVTLASRVWLRFDQRSHYQWLNMCAHKALQQLVMQAESRKEDLLQALCFGGAGACTQMIGRLLWRSRAW